MRRTSLTGSRVVLDVAREHVDLVLETPAEEHEAGAGGKPSVALLVAHDGLAVANTKRFQVVKILLLGGHHVRIGRVLVAEIVNVEEHGAFGMVLLERGFCLLPTSSAVEEEVVRGVGEIGS